MELLFIAIVFCETSTIPTSRLNRVSFKIIFFIMIIISFFCIYIDFKFIIVLIMAAIKKMSIENFLKYKLFSFHKKP